MTNFAELMSSKAEDIAEPVGLRWTSEQQAVFDAAALDRSNLLLSALAGAAKTTTLVELSNRINEEILVLAFNVRIKDELTKRLPPNATALTLNGVGHRTWASSIGRRLIVDKDKVYDLFMAEFNKLSRGEKDHIGDALSLTMSYVRQGKSAGWVPDGTPRAKSLLTNDEFFESLSEEPSLVQEELIIKVSRQSVDLALQGKIDYDDQILMPTIFFGAFRSYPNVLVDETQDLSQLNHLMVQKIVKKGRLIAVGDANQSIYAFRGAHENSMQLMRATFDMKELFLNVSFRCPIAVVKEARRRAPSMAWPEWAKQGEVRSLPSYTAEEFAPGSVILCRNNAPLFALALRLLRNGKFPEIVGKDVGKGLVKIMKKLNDLDATCDEARESLAAWKRAKLEKSRDPGAIEDQAECIEVFLDATDTLGQAIAYAEHMMSFSGQIKLSTIHKAKGLEWPNVYILDVHRINRQHTQENNLWYVAVTRSQDRLTYIDLENFKESRNGPEQLISEH